MDLLKQETLTEGTLIKTESQTAGRGQYGNTWQSEKGRNLTFSLVIHPTFLAPTRQFYLSKITSLAVLGMLTEFVPASQYDIAIKWPNDILVHGEKIAGILIENMLGTRGTIQSSVIGVGINVNQLNFANTARKALSLAGLLGKEQDRRVILERFCNHFEALYLNLKQGRLEMISKQYLLNLYQYQVPANYRSGGESLRGSITGIQENGLLLLETEKCLRTFNFKEIEFL